MNKVRLRDFFLFCYNCGHPGHESRLCPEHPNFTRCDRCSVVTHDPLGHHPLCPDMNSWVSDRINYSAAQMLQQRRPPLKHAFTISLELWNVSAVNYSAAPNYRRRYRSIQNNKYAADVWISIGWRYSLTIHIRNKRPWTYLGFIAWWAI